MSIPSSRDLRHIARALEASTASDVPRTKLGAIIAHGNRVVGQGCNITKTHPEQDRYNNLVGNKRPRAQLHAEMSAILRVGLDNCEGATIYVGRFDKRGRLAEARPCRACALAIRGAGIKRAVYTTADGVCFYDVA